MVTITNLKNKIWEGHQPHMCGSVYFGTLSQLISKIITTSINLAESQIRKKKVDNALILLITLSSMVKCCKLPVF
jgi:hypothetical protein